MLGLRSAWGWCFHVSDPKDPKLRGWLHPAFALALNFGLASTVALLFFLATPSVFQEMWLRRQPAAVVTVVQQAQKLAESLGYSGTATVQLVRDSLGGILLPDVAFFDKNQVFAMYSWEGAIVEPHFLAASLLAYVLVMLGCRVYEMGPVMLYDMAWACNMSMVLAAADQLLWYADTVAFLVRGRFLIGLAKYMANKDTVGLPQMFSRELSVVYCALAQGERRRIRI
ncbi:hypothetical protein ACSSS7_001506 [Eimeria intestinalis]